MAPLLPDAQCANADVLAVGSLRGLYMSALVTLEQALHLQEGELQSLPCCMGTYLHMTVELTAACTQTHTQSLTRISFCAAINMSTCV